MDRNRDAFIANLTDDLEPVRAFRKRDGMIVLGAALAATAAGVALYHGFWGGIAEGEAAAMFWIANGLMLLLGLVSAGTVIAMASPQVGSTREAPKWAAAMVGVLPFAALATVLSQGAKGGALADPYGWYCVSSAIAASLLLAAAMVVWLRRGAPVSAPAAGWLTGLASGALGTVIYGFACPIDSVTHLGIWHVVPVAVAALIGRLAVPPLVRW